MTKWWPAVLLAGTLLLGYCYGQERAALAVADARIAALSHRADSLTIRSRLAQLAYDRSRQTADSLSRIAREIVPRRVRLVTATDSALGRVLADSATPAAFAPIVLSLRTALLAERAVSDSAIASLSATVAAKDVALSAADSVIAVQRLQLAASAELVSVLRRESHPSFAVRAGEFLRHAAVGAAVMAVFVLVRHP